MRAAVSLHIDAPPDQVWRLVSDITKMGEYSPEVVEAEADERLTDADDDQATYDETMWPWPTSWAGRAVE